MKFSEDQETGLYLLKGYGDGWVQINDSKIETGFILGPSILIQEGVPETFSQLTRRHLQQIFAQDMEILLIGTGRSHGLPTPEIHQALVTHQTGFEYMTTAAACRTYKVLSAEGRSVIALLFPG